MSPPEKQSSNDDRSFGPENTGFFSWINWLRQTDNSTTVYIRELLESVILVVLVGLILFAISGVWPPMVAVESGSMEPHMERGDLIFVTATDRFIPDAAKGQTGVVTYESGVKENYKKFGEPGDVIIFEPFGRTNETPIIHRAHFWVKKNENWYAKANPKYIRNADDCDELPSCPAPYSGFITKGDHNDAYDQVLQISSPVKPNWVRGTAEVKIPLLGHIRLIFSEHADQASTRYQSHRPVINKTQYGLPK